MTLNRKKIFNFFATSFFIGIIVAVTTWLAYATVRADYLPLSGDAWVHAYKVKFILEFWPNINWFHHWAAGMPLLLWYSKLSYYLMVILAWFLKSIPLSTSFWPAISIGFLGIGAFALAYEVTRSRLAGLIAALLTIPLTALWSRIVVGEIPRMIGYGFVTLAIWATVRFIRIYQEKGRVDAKNFVLTVFFVSLSLQGHAIPMVFSVAINGLIIFFCIKSFKEKFKVLFKIFIPATLLAGYFVIPYFLTQRISQIQTAAFFGSFEVYPAVLKHFFWVPPYGEYLAGNRWRPGGYGGLSPLHLPLLLIFFIPFLFKTRKLFKEKLMDSQSLLIFKLILALFLLTVIFIVFGTAIYLGWPNTWYNTALQPDEAFYLLGLVLPSLIALLFYFLFNKWKKTYLVLSLLFLFVLGIWAKVQYPLRFPYNDPNFIQDSPALLYHWKNYDNHPIYRFLKNDLGEKQFRIGISDSGTAGWFNYDYDIPQTRDFFSQALLYPDWRAWSENAIWHWNKNDEETRFLLDWSSIKWVLLMPGYCHELSADSSSLSVMSCTNLEKFKENKEDFKIHEVSPEIYKIAEFNKPSPILSATNAPSILILGKQESDVSYGKTKKNKYEVYNPIFRSLAYTNFNSQKIIPILGKEYIDDYKIKELSKFKSIFLYQYKFHNQEKAFKLLKQYVEQGGGLIIEISETKEAEKMEKLSTGLPEIFPMDRIVKKEKNKNWDFKSEDHFITKDIDFSKFSDALYNNAPWKIQTTDKGDVKGGAKTVLYSGDDPLMLTEELGSGRVIWSGMSLPYHTISNKNPEEAKLLEHMIRWVTKTDQNEELTQSSYQANFINPQKREVILNNSATGVLFKENFFMDWHAYIVKNDGKKEKARIYDAGLDFMYVPITDNVGKVVFEYKLSWLEKISNITSIITLIWLIYLLFFGKTLVPKIPLINKPTLKLKRKLGKFWTDEENY